MRLNNCCNDRCRGGFLVCFGVVLSILFGVLIAVLFALGFIPFITTAVIVVIVTAAIALVILFGGAYISEAGGNTQSKADRLCKLDNVADNRNIRHDAITAHNALSIVPSLHHKFLL